MATERQRVHAGSRWVVGALLLALLAGLAHPPDADADSRLLSNPTRIGVADSLGESAVGKATLYPSQITVSGLAGTIVNTVVYLDLLSHPSPTDLDVLLVGPTGASVLLMSDAGRNTANAFVAFTKTSGMQVPANGPLSSTAYVPTNYSPDLGSGDCAGEADPDTFPSPAPLAPYGPSLATFDGTNPNGIWQLFVVDDCHANTGEVGAGWRLEIETALPPVPPRPIFTFGGDLRSDPGVWNPQTGRWFAVVAGGGVYSEVLGGPDDIPVPADYDGDGRTDAAIFMPRSGTWFIVRSGGGVARTAWGTAGDIPVPADYDGDGKADVAVFRPGAATWAISRSGGGTTSVSFGNNNSIPVPADYDGDGKADITAWYPPNGSFVTTSSATGSYRSYALGHLGGIPASADYDGDGRANFAVFQPVQGIFSYILANGSGAAVRIGQDGDIPVPGDYDGDGKDDFAVYHPQNGLFFVVKSSNGGVIAENFGASGYVPLQKRPNYNRVYPYDVRAGATR